jgi:hypothetical protein
MTSSTIINVSFFLSLILSGFYGGTGFFVLIGGNPAIELMTNNTFAEYWQHLDFFMAARMKIFGPLLLVTIIVNTILLLKQYRTPAFWCMLAALLILLADVLFVFSVNHPLNLLIQAWDLNNLPGNVAEVKWKVVTAFNTRALFMIGSFLMAVLAILFYNNRYFSAAKKLS